MASIVVEEVSSQQDSSYISELKEVSDANVEIEKLILSPSRGGQDAEQAPASKEDNSINQSKWDASIQFFQQAFAQQKAGNDEEFRREDRQNFLQTTLSQIDDQFESDIDDRSQGATPRGGEGGYTDRDGEGDKALHGQKQGPRSDDA
jgi:hypothetical protein